MSHRGGGPIGGWGVPAGGAWRVRVAAALLGAAIGMAGCGGGSDGTGRNAPAYPVAGTVVGLETGQVELSNGLDQRIVKAGADDGALLDAAFAFDTPLPRGATYDVRIINDPFALYGLQCDVRNGRGTMPTGGVSQVQVRCARVKSVRFLAGNDPVGGAGRDGLGQSARFSVTDAIATDAAGNVYVADTGNHTIRRITPTGLVSTLAGSNGLPGAADGIGGDARFRSPQGIAVAPDGSLYVSDSGNHAVRRVTGDGRVATVLSLSPSQTPQALVVDARAVIHVVVLEGGLQQVLYRVEPEPAPNTGLRATAVRDLDSLVPPPARPGWLGLAIDRNQRLVVATQAGRLLQGPANDMATATALSTEWPQQAGTAGVLIDDRGTVWVTVRGQPSCGLWRLSVGSPPVRQLPCGTTPGTLIAPGGLTLAAGGALRVLDQPVGAGPDAVIRQVVAATEEVGTFAGNPGQVGVVDGLRGDARFTFSDAAVCNRLAVDAQGRVYTFDDVRGGSIRRIDPDGTVLSLPRAPDAPAFGDLRGIAVDRGTGTVYVTDATRPGVWRIGVDGSVTALNPVISVTAGTAVQPVPVALAEPCGIAVDSVGQVLVSDRREGRFLWRYRPADTEGSAYAGPLDLTLESLGLASAGALAVGPDDSVYIATATANGPGGRTGILRVFPVVDVVFFDPTPPVLIAPLEDVQSLAVDASSIVYLLDRGQVKTAEPLDGGQNHDLQVMGGVRLDTAQPTDPPKVGALPQLVGTPGSVALTRDRLYFTANGALMFVDR